MSNSNIKVSSRPPEKKYSDDEKFNELAEIFISEGNIGGEIKEGVKISSIVVFPWEDARDDVYKTFNLRLPEEYAVKLDYLAMKLKTSKHAICMRVVKNEIDHLLEEYSSK